MWVRTLRCARSVDEDGAQVGDTQDDLLLHQGAIKHSGVLRKKKGVASLV